MLREQNEIAEVGDTFLTKEGVTLVAVADKVLHDSCAYCYYAKRLRNCNEAPGGCDCNKFAWHVTEQPTTIEDTSSTFQGE